MNCIIRWLLSGAITTMAASVACAGEVPEAPNALVYDETSRSAVPIPPGEADLPVVVATEWYKVSDEGLILEGPAFDRAGNLYFTNVSGGQIMRISAEGELSVVFDRPGLGPGGLAIHKDGRIFIAAADNVQSTGSIIAIQPDGSEEETIVPVSAGFAPNDIVFDNLGGFYFTDFRGTSTDLKGGVYYVSPEETTIVPVARNVAMGNGLALSPGDTELWFDAFSRNELHRVVLAAPGTPAPFGTAIAYHFAGPAPDGMRKDADGNLYVSLYGQGRVLALSPTGVPIGQILLPGRQEGHNLASTNLAIKPGTDELYIVTSDGDRGQGATIFRAQIFAEALTLYSHR